MTASGDDGTDPGDEHGNSGGTDREETESRTAPEESPVDPDEEPGSTDERDRGSDHDDLSSPSEPVSDPPRTVSDQQPDVDGLAEEQARRRETLGEEHQRPPPYVGSGDGPQSGRSSGARQDDSWQLFTRDLLTSVLAVALLGMYLFAVSGVWPPMVAIESESMEPNMNVNDLVFLMDTDRFQPGDAHADTGVVSAQVGEETGYGNYGDTGDVIVFEPDGDGDATPIIHRAMFWVDEGENWCEIASEGERAEYLGTLSTDDERCIAPNDGFITKGDNNNYYDQASSTQADRPVKQEWIIGTAELRVPRLGWFRLQFV